MTDIRRSTDAYWLLGDLVVVHLTGEQTDGAFELVEFVMPPGDMTPLQCTGTKARRPTCTRAR